MRKLPGSIAGFTAISNEWFVLLILATRRVFLGVTWPFPDGCFQHGLRTLGIAGRYLKLHVTNCIAQQPDVGYETLVCQEAFNSLCL